LTRQNKWSILNHRDGPAAPCTLTTGPLPNPLPNSKSELHLPRIVPLRFFAEQFNSSSFPPLGGTEGGAFRRPRELTFDDREVPFGDPGSCLSGDPRRLPRLFTPFIKGGQGGFLNSQFEIPIPPEFFLIPGIFLIPRGSLWVPVIQDLISIQEAGNPEDYSDRPEYLPL
jgi:hypothetical protein